MSYAHLSQYERYQIQHLHRGGFSSRGIGEQIERSPSTIGRELQRNARGVPYESRQAQRQSTQRRHAASSQTRLEESIWPIVRAALAEELSPEQIVGSKKVPIRSTLIIKSDIVLVALVAPRIVGVPVARAQLPVSQLGACATQKRCSESGRR